MSWSSKADFPTPYDLYAASGEPSGAEPPLYYCAGCGEGIYEGDRYYDLFEGDYCEECILNFRRTAWE